MFRYLTIAVFLTTALVISAFAMAPDALDADPEHYTLEFENDHVRIIRIKYGPGEKSVMHSHGPSVAVGITDTRTRMTFPDGTSIDDEMPAGGAQWADAGDHLPENLTDHAMEVLLIELKE